MRKKCVDFFKCFWVPIHQTSVVVMCGFLCFLPIHWLGILTKIAMILIVGGLLGAIGWGGCIAYRSQQLEYKRQREATIQEAKRIEVYREEDQYVLIATSKDSIILFKQFYFTEREIVHELKKWIQKNPQLRQVQTNLSEMKHTQGLEKVGFYD